MSDSEDANSRRAARPSTPPFRGPAGPASRPPLTPPGSGAGKLPGPPPGQGGARTPVAPFAVPPAGARGRPATPVKDARSPAPTPTDESRATPPAEGGSRETPPRPRTPTDSEAAAIPAYGSAPPPSIAATLKSISEFTIVEEPADSETASAGDDRYEPPTVTARAADDETAASGNHDDFVATAPGHDALWIPAPVQEPAGDAAADQGESHAAGPDEPLYDNPTTDLDVVLSAPPFEADRLFEQQAQDGGDEGSNPGPGERETNDDVIASAFGAVAPDIDGASEAGESPGREPVYIGGDPSTRFVAESLEEIARGIRAGEIALPPIDPSAEQPAVLAAVLAAILAPRR